MMNKAVVYISETTNETVNNMIAEVLERYQNIQSGFRFCGLDAEGFHFL